MERVADEIKIIIVAGEQDLEQITLVKDAIHRPDEPRHFMQWKFPEKRVCAAINGVSVADTTDPLILSEVGYGIYDPVVYFPINDVAYQHLEKIDKSTFCPLKGDTEYFDLKHADNASEKEIAWSYARPVDFAQQLQQYVAFDPAKVIISMPTIP